MALCAPPVKEFPRLLCPDHVLDQFPAGIQIKQDILVQKTYFTGNENLRG